MKSYKEIDSGEVNAIVADMPPDVKKSVSNFVAKIDDLLRLKVLELYEDLLKQLPMVALNGVDGIKSTAEFTRVNEGALPHQKMYLTVELKFDDADDEGKELEDDNEGEED